MGEREVRDDEVWDVVVVGAGPAGSAAALAARRADPDARVLLLDRADFPRDKACGDGVASHALDVLAALGVHDATEGFLPVHRFRLRTPRGTEVARRMQRPAFVVPRTVFDARLVEAARASGAQVRHHRVRRVDVGPDRVVLDGAIAARAVVGADGAESVVRRALGLASNGAGHVALALRAYARTPAGGEGEQVIQLAEGRLPAYAWTFPIGDGWSNVGYGELLRGQTPTRAYLQDRLGALLPDAGAGLRDSRAHRLPLSTRRPRVPDGPIVLAGDAHSLINPFTGEGIFYAILSGALAGRAALDGRAAASTYRRLLRAELGAHLRDTTTVARLTGSRRIVDAAVRTAASDQTSFDALVELGLGRGRLRAGLLARAAAAALRRRP